MFRAEVHAVLGLVFLVQARVHGAPVESEAMEAANPHPLNVPSKYSEAVPLDTTTPSEISEATGAAVVEQNSWSERADGTFSGPSAVRAFQDVMVGICEKAYPDLRAYSGTFTPFFDTNCSVLCIYGKPEVPIPDGGPCYLKLDFVGTPGSCLNGECVIPGKPFEFQPHHKDYPLLYAMFDAVPDQ